MPYINGMVNAVAVKSRVGGKIEKWYCGYCAAVRRPKDPRKAFTKNVDAIKSVWIG